MNRRRFLKTVGITVAALALPRPVCAAYKKNKKPNLLFVMADQFRKQAIGFMDQDPVITPNFDKFAKRSMVFTNAVSSCPICSPFRAMLMTGRFPLSTGVASNCMPGTDLQLKEDEICFGDVLRANGYSTGYIGKWHLEIPSLNKAENPPDGATVSWDGWTPPGPRRHGFDFWYAYNCNGRHFDPVYWKHTPKRIDIKQWSVEHETDVAIDFIKKRQKEKPFALFVSWNPPHTPYVAPDKYKALYKDKKLPPRPNVKSSQKYEKSVMPYYAAVSSCDDNFGRLLKALDELGIADNTIVVFTADHGEMMGSHGRFAKSVWFEESIGIPFMIRWPRRIKPRRENMPFAVYDFMPTILGLMGLSISKTVEATDYSALLLGKDMQKPTSALIASYGNPGKLLALGQKPSKWALAAEKVRLKGIDWRTIGYRGLRTKRYTYVVDRGREDKNIKRLLYDNEKDPYQLNPIQATSAQENPIMAKLDKELQRWLNKMNDPFPLK
jgi:arylsulfatase A-like enzyme